MGSRLATQVFKRLKIHSRIVKIIPLQNVNVLEDILVSKCDVSKSIGIKIV